MVGSKNGQIILDDVSTLDPHEIRQPTCCDMFANLVDIHGQSHLTRVLLDEAMHGIASAQSLLDGFTVLLLPPHVDGPELDIQSSFTDPR